MWRDKHQTQRPTTLLQWSSNSNVSGDNNSGFIFWSLRFNLQPHHCVNLGTCLSLAVLPVCKTVTWTRGPYGPCIHRELQHLTSAPPPCVRVCPGCWGFSQRPDQHPPREGSHPRRPSHFHLLPLREVHKSSSLPHLSGQHPSSEKQNLHQIKEELTGRKFPES